MESIIHSYRRLIDIKSLTSVQLVKGKESNCELFQFLILKLWEFARLFAAMACVNLVFPPQKLNSNEAFQRDTREFYAALFSLNSFSFRCAVYYTNVQIERTWKDSPRAYICCRTENFARPFTTNKFFWENSDNKWMKVPSIISIVTKYLTL